MDNGSSRHEFKYLLPKNTARRIINFVERLKLKKDTSQNGSYFVTSLYFDTPQLSDYYDKLGGFLQRQKLRARIYQKSLKDGGRVNLEVKAKKDTRVSKKKYAITDKEWGSFCGNFSLRHFPQKAGEKELNGREFLDLFTKRCYKPTILVRYKRKAYVDRFISDVRLTFDSDIEAAWSSDLNYRRKMVPVYKNSVVMEIKFREAMPWWFKEMIYRFELKRQVFSKYSNSLDAVNRFHPLPR